MVKKLSQRKGLKYMEYKDVVGKSFKQLLPGKVSGLLILVMDKRKNNNVGHYVLFMRHPRSGLTFFDPYLNQKHQYHWCTAKCFLERSAHKKVLRSSPL